jgi:hypothetical protein
MTHLLIAALLSFAPVDKCKPGAREGTSANGKYRVIPTTDYKFEFQSKNDEGAFATRFAGALVDAGHPHLETFVFDDGSGFIITNLTGGHHVENRIVIYSADGKTRKAVSLADFLTADQLKDLDPSVSHIWFSKGVKMSEPLRAIQLATKWSITFTVEFPTGRVLKPEQLGSVVADFLESEAREIDDGKLAELAAKLDADEPAERDAACAAIRKLGFRTAEKLTGGTAEQKRRVEALLQEFGPDIARFRAGLHKDAAALASAWSGASKADAERIRKFRK